jgi:acyl carrier protein
VPIASRTPEGDPFSCRVCGAVDRIEVSPLVADAVCTRCGGYLAKFLGHFDERIGRGKPIPLDADLAPLLAAEDSLDVLEGVMELEEELGVRMDFDEVQRCRTIEDLAHYLHRLNEEKYG